MIRWAHTTDKLVFEAAYSTNTLAEPAERQVIPPGHLGIGRLSAIFCFYSLVTTREGEAQRADVPGPKSPGTGLTRPSTTGKCSILSDLTYFSCLQAYDERKQQTSWHTSVLHLFHWRWLLGLCMDTPLKTNSGWWIWQFYRSGKLVEGGTRTNIIWHIFLNVILVCV